MGTSHHSPGQLEDLIARPDVGNASNYCGSNRQSGLVDLLGLLFKSFPCFLYTSRRKSTNIKSELTSMTPL